MITTINRGGTTVHRLEHIGRTHLKDILKENENNTMFGVLSQLGGSTSAFQRMGLWFTSAPPTGGHSPLWQSTTVSSHHCSREHDPG